MGSSKGTASGRGAKRTVCADPLDAEVMKFYGQCYPAGGVYAIGLTGAGVRDGGEPHWVGWSEETAPSRGALDGIGTTGAEKEKLFVFLI